MRNYKLPQILNQSQNEFFVETFDNIDLALDKAFDVLKYEPEQNGQTIKLIVGNENKSIEFHIRKILSK